MAFLDILLRGCVCLFFHLLVFSTYCTVGSTYIIVHMFTEMQ